MLHIALYEPEIPPNTGNIMRLCANTGCTLHLIHPLSFDLDEKRLKRAGMDYRDMAVVREHENFTVFMQSIGATANLYALTTKGHTTHSSPEFSKGDVLLFGPESRGLPADVLEQLQEHQKLRIPMLPESRSLNLANAVSVMMYEALRQLDYEGLR